MSHPPGGTRAKSGNGSALSTSVAGVTKAPEGKADVPIVFRPLPQDDPKQRCPDISKARRLLKWEPKVDLAEGLRLTLDYFQTRLASSPCSP